MKNLALAVLVLGLGACHLTNPSPRAKDEEPVPAAPAPEPVKRDESLAPADAPGTIRIVQEPLRDVEGISKSKTWLLEMYQSAVAAKDQLAIELEAARRDDEESRRTHDALVAERDLLATRSVDLEKRVRELESQTLDLARRLAESEIARLEAEKADLEQAAAQDRKGNP